MELAPDAGVAAGDATRVYEAQEEFAPRHVRDAALARDLADKTERSAPAVVVSGGISMGAYQAGFVSTLVRFWSVAHPDGTRARQGGPAPRVWTGASAGAVNALLGGLASCDLAFAQPRWTPEDSLFWEVWIQKLDLEQLLPWEDPDRKDHLLSAPYMQETLQAIATRAREADFKQDCSFAFGLTVTNLRGRDITFGEGGTESRARLKRVTERLVTQVSTHGKGQLSVRHPFVAGAPSATPPYIAMDAIERHYYPALGATRPEGEGGQPISIEDLLSGPRASGSFPLAFPPVDLSASFFNPEAGWGAPEVLKVVDGGFLNNNPVDLAVRLGARWRDAEEAAAGFNPARFPIVYLDQDVVAWDWAPAAHAPPWPSPLEKTYLQYVGNLLTAAQDNVVLDTLEHDPALSGRIKIPRRGSVLPSEYRFSMMGFFDRRFREHDFFRGMQDAIRFLATQFSTTESVARLVPPVASEPLAQREQRIRERLGIASAGFACVADGACSGSKALEELGRLREASEALTRRAKQGQLEEDQVDALLSELGRVGYHYSEGVLKGALATGSRRDLMPARVRIGKAFHDLVSHQKGALRLALRPAGAAFLDEWLTYARPRYAVTFQASRRRGVGLGLEAPLMAFEGAGCRARTTAASCGSVGR
ncbi:patatin-like phospholipase family protein [Pyxidicoccus sp. 3LFB2]